MHNSIYNLNVFKTSGVSAVSTCNVTQYFTMMEFKMVLWEHWAEIGIGQIHLKVNDEAEFSLSVPENMGACIF